MGKDIAQNSIAHPAELKLEMTSSLHFHISKNMVHRFSDLTGDHSLLHSDKEFARRSVYRQQVVHGMLPVAFISTMKFLHINGYRCLPVDLSGQFLEPVYIGDDLSLHGQIVDINKENFLFKCNYSIVKVKTDTISVKGTLNFYFLPFEKNERDSESIGAQHRPSATIEEALSLRDLKLEEISIKDKDGFIFSVSEDSINALLGILSEGIIKKGRIDPSVISKQFYFPDLLSTILFSTSAGMCIPGKYATFLGFETRTTQPVNINTDYRLNGEIVHVSRSTRLIKKNISIQHPDNARDSISNGTISVLVNPPPVQMQTVRELKESALDMGLENSVVLITGASRGIGEITAKLFAILGGRVIVNYLKGTEDAERIVDEIMREGGDAFCIQADVSDAKQVQKMVKQAVKKYGAINILVNNAVKDFKPINFERLTWDEVQKDVDVVVKGAFNCSKEVIPLMLKQGGGKIINMGTVATDNPPSGQIKYVISKSGLVGLTRSLSIEFAAKNIQINMVVPNFIETDLVSHIPDAYKKKIAKDTPMQRNASPVDVARAIVFLASSYSSFTTGQKIMVTGGGAPYS